MKEIFKDIPEYEGLYQVSNLGKVKSLSKKVRGNKCFFITKEKFLKPYQIGKDYKKNNGYLAIKLYKNNKNKNYPIHLLVLKSFIGKSNLQANHKDGDKKNNRLDNLEYVTQSQNIIHAFKNNLMTHNKLTEEQVKKILTKTQKNNIKRGYWKNLALKLKVSQSTISHIKHNKYWKHIKI